MRTSARKHRLGLALVLGGLCCPLLVAAQSTPDELARTHFNSGVAYLTERDYDEALKAFTKAYELSKRAPILINIATVYELQGELAESIRTLEQFLVEAPNDQDAPTIRLRRDKLKEQLDRNKAKKPASTDASLSPKPDASTPNQPAADKATTAPAPSGPNRVPAYIALGAGTGSLLAALATGFVAKSQYDQAKSDCSPNCSDSQLSSSKTMAWTSTALTGVGVLGLGIGGYLWWAASSEREKQPERAGELHVDVSISPQSAQASFGWRF